MCCFSGDPWPSHRVVTYDKKLVDTHTAMNMSSGIFTVPCSGTYGFLFNAEFFCDFTSRSAHVYQNEEKIQIFHCSTLYQRPSFRRTNSVYFALKLSENDTVKIWSGSAYLNLNYSAAKFMGLLLHRL
jgi:hypothetical protein